VFFGDACEIRTMVQVGMERADLVVAVTGDVEDNLIICHAARRWFGVLRAIGRVNNPSNEDAFHKLGVEEAISSQCASPSSGRFLGTIRRSNLFSK